MFLRELKQPVSTLGGAGPQISARLGRLGIVSVADLLCHFPRDYEDRSRIVPFSRFAAEPFVYTVAEVTGHEWFGYGKMKTLKIHVRDESSEAVLICFNRPFLEKSLPVGAKVAVYGKFQFRYGEIQSSSFEADRALDGARSGMGLSPVYPLTEGIGQQLMRKLAKLALAMYGSRVENELAVSLMKARGILPKAEALKSIHFPSSPEERIAARRSLAYEELFWFQLGIAMRTRKRLSQTIPRKKGAGILVKRLLERLPFRLTSGQDMALSEILADMDSPRPMARMLQGDVGSGKTIVALLAAMLAVERGGQAAIMAPTELLARQHAATAAKLLEPLGVRLAFLTGNVDDSARPPLLEALEKGEIDIVIGTHALFSEEVRYRALQFIVIDEQHRFGVLQRSALFRKGNQPDLLMMTATPIPRSLALTIFGDMAVSTIRSMPPGRKPVKTHLAKEGREEKVYEFVRSLLKQGRQAYFVYPLIGESERSELKNAEMMAQNLSAKVFPGHSVRLLHSRMKEEEKRRIMDSFVSGSTDILVSTTVVEVGVDVPNAAAMVVEHAERFGLSALHQLRGRVGRGEHQAYCFFVYSENITEDAVRRLKALYGTNDGFALAEEDLKIRGPGELLGTAQSGSFRLLVADPLRDFDLLKDARADAFALSEADPGFLRAENAVYREVIARACPQGISQP